MYMHEQAHPLLLPVHIRGSSGAIQCLHDGALSKAYAGAALVNAAATSTTMWRLAMVNITELDLLCTEVEDGQTLETKLTFSGS